MYIEFVSEKLMDPMIKEKHRESTHDKISYSAV
jgi:hypothetical protein